MMITADEDEVLFPASVVFFCKINLSVSVSR